MFILRFRSWPLLVLGVMVGFAQSGWSTLELEPKIGYQFTGGKDLAGPKFDRMELKDTTLRGFSVGYINGERGELAFTWTRSLSSAEILRSGGIPSDRFDVRIDQMRVDGMYMFSDDSLRPFLLIGLGGTRYTPDGSRQTTTRFSGAVGGGVKWMWGDHLGMRFDALWTPSYVPLGTHFFCDASGTDECHSTEANSIFARYPFLHSFEFSTGLLLRL